MTTSSVVLCTGEYPAKDDPIGAGVGGCYYGKCNITYDFDVDRHCVHDKEPVKWPEEDLSYSWSCWQCPLGNPLAIAFGTVDHAKSIVRVTDKLNYTDVAEVLEFRLQVLAQVPQQSLILFFFLESADCEYDELFARNNLPAQDNVPPTRGICVADNNRGIAVITHFHIDCSGFVDYEDADLTFEFYYCDLKPDEVRRHTFRTLHQSCILLKSKVNGSAFEGVLPQGRPERNYEALIVLFCIDSTGQFTFTTVDMVVESGSCSGITLKNVKQYQYDASLSLGKNGSEATVSEVLSYIQSSSIMIKSKFYKDCDKQMRGQVLKNQTEVREDFVEYLKTVPVTSAGDLHEATKVLDAILPTSFENTTLKFIEDTVELLDKYTGAYENFTSEDVHGRIANRTTAIGEAIAVTITATLKISAPPPDEVPDMVPENVTTTPECVTAETLIDNLGRVAQAVSRVVDTEVDDLSIMYEDYELWIRDSQRSGFLGSVNGTRVRLERKTEQQTSIVFPSSPFRCHTSGRFSNTQAVKVNSSNTAARVRGRQGSKAPIQTGMETFLKKETPLEYQDNTTYETSLRNVSVHQINNTESGAYLRVHLVPRNATDEFIFAAVVNRTPNREDFIEQNRYHVDALVGNHYRWIRIEEQGTVFLAVLPVTELVVSALKDPHVRPDRTANRLRVQLTFHSRLLVLEHRSQGMGHRWLPCSVGLRPAVRPLRVQPHFHLHWWSFHCTYPY
ncbi:uncharacterized protein LOC135390548 [Ornithodoros turicata]|uniref:uncharacterized protein LOC135390548 n=1 Tax=Ornithodoros turicata TaxID=34597 RepID=UPI003138942B